MISCEGSRQEDCAEFELTEQDPCPSKCWQSGRNHRGRGRNHLSIPHVVGAGLCLWPTVYSQSRGYFIEHAKQPGNGPSQDSQESLTVQSQDSLEICKDCFTKDN